jgi:hypothetical protein
MWGSCKINYDRLQRFYLAPNVRQLQDKLRSVTEILFGAQHGATRRKKLKYNQCTVICVLQFSHCDINLYLEWCEESRWLAHRPLFVSMVIYRNHLNFCTRNIQTPHNYSFNSLSQNFHSCIRIQISTTLFSTCTLNP